MKENNENSPTGLFKLLPATAPNKVFLAILLGSLAGIAYAIVVPLVLLSLQPSLSRLMQPEFESSYWLLGTFEISSPTQAFFYFSIVLLILLCRVISETMVAQTSIDATVGLRKKLYKRISQLPIQSLEQIGQSRILTALNNDIGRVTEGAAVLPNILVAASTLVGMLAFLMYLKLEVFLFIIGIIVFGVVTYRIPLFFGQKHLVKARNSFDGIQEGIRGLIYGAKELKLNQQKKHAYLTENLHAYEENFAAAQKRGRFFLSVGLNYGTLISFFAIGIVTYIMANYYTLSQANLMGVVMVLLYITGPMSALINLMNGVIMARVAAKKLDHLLNEMPIEASGDIADPVDCQQLRVEGLEYIYPALNSADSAFHLGPVDLTLKRGEVTFLVGGNGSGKTTLSKLLSLHYIPGKGQISFDDQAINDNNREACRQSVSAIYSDFYLFTKLHGLSSENIDQRAMQYIKDLGLEGKVTIKNGQFSSTDLSDGQKKRLALLVTYLEDRSIYVFDEWAADQDPGFKEIFYHRILPELKLLNKMVIVITHDDRYFYLADKLVKMENGKVAEEINKDNLAIAALKPELQMKGFENVSDEKERLEADNAGR
ncbi:cyclic peptide export ABC transporter [Thalassomonas actiniarum]|uniref:Cyclic peptide export ABC transporter n=1 Tax=Thalassomonas actiniarum TaxID=485447 RepID=A0AAF0C6J7_9GAMM|nr:cyclic peptide export ABC transporter [Thalassomonas actiniarum]WDE02356.1 cyclic peptide export ABC transporter [Thalassomonas actiniarum]